MSHTYLDPIAAINEPRKDFIRYLLTAYPIKDKVLYQKIKEKLEQPGVVWQHPYLEGAQPYEVGQSIADLVQDNVLHPRISALFPGNRRLYRHQQAAITAVVKQQQNIVVATGTGSGKTECFLVPMVDRLLKEEHNLGLFGVRALILYPMNALVNDQVKRLRQILCKQDPKQPLIRFGFYTSRTEKDPKEALEALRLELDGYGRDDLLALFTEAERQQLDLTTSDRLIQASVNKIQAVQILSREEIWKTPPHILVTNYSMLEHMLIRPKERREIFAASSNTFDTLILDEAHTYDGSTGTEVAMLLKRFKVALNQEKGQIRCIATSASLGDSSDDTDVLEFANSLFDEEFVQVVRGNRQTADRRLGDPYELPKEFDHQSILENLSLTTIPEQKAPLQSWLDELCYFVPDEVLQDAKSHSGDDFHRLLWFALKQHPIFHRLINLLRQPQSWDNVVQSSELWQIAFPVSLDGSLDAEAVRIAEYALAKLLQFGTLARENPDDLPLLPVRIHLLFRSLEGVYSCINPKCREIYLNEKYTCDRCNSPVLELATCAQCGEDYVITQLEPVTGKLLPLPRRNPELRNNSAIYTLSLKSPDSRVEEEDELEDEDLEEPTTDDPLARQFSIEFRDGWVGRPRLENFQPFADAKRQQYNMAWHRRPENKGVEGCYLPKCAACGSRPNRAQAINRFISYTDAPLEAMIDQLFNLLPEPQKQSNDVSKRKLLAFSDGRQDAAFFASDFQRNHTEIVYRQMVWEAFRRGKNPANSTSITGLLEELRNIFLETPIPHPDRNSDQHHKSYKYNNYRDSWESLGNRIDCEKYAEKRAKELLVREFAIPYARRSSLEAYAILACHIEIESNDPIVQWVAEEFQISSAEAYVFLIGLTDIIRRSGVVSIDGASAYFPETGGEDGSRPPVIDVKGRSKQVLFLEKDEDDRKKYPASPAFMPRWKKDGAPMQAQNRLGWYFMQLLPALPERGQFVALFRKMEEANLLVNRTTTKGFHLHWEKLIVQETQCDWYQCDCCQQIVHVPSLSQISDPTLNLYTCRAFRCKGSLQPYSVEMMVERTAQHYQQHLAKKAPLPLRSQEHTAQLGTEELARRENDFRQGKINLLSCSTTLEMGVDIGELQAVVLRNFPPHVSNYQQRAGRAGRRTDGVALTLMYGQRRPHDRYYFAEPERLIAGSNRIPKLDPGNHQIQQRHIRAELLSTFLAARNVGTEQVLIGDFFDLSEENPFLLTDAKPIPNSMSMQLLTWLHGDDSKKLTEDWLSRLQSAASPQTLIQNFCEDLDRFIKSQVGDWNELVGLLLDLDGELEAVKCKLDEKKQLQRRFDGLLVELKKIARRQLHEQLVQAAILPIYGFPIDVVRLLTGDSNEYKSSKGRHRLERDRRLALSEYAPGQDVVVDDRVHHSVGVLRPSDLESKYYWVCRSCNHFESSLNNGDQTIDECPTCHQTPEKPADRKVYAYRVPKAFITDWAEKPKVTAYLKPQRQPTSQVFLANPGNPSNSWKIDEICRLTSSHNGQFFLANRGSFTGASQAFHICNKCGRDLAEAVLMRNKKTTKSHNQKKEYKPIVHTHPITGRECKGGYDLIHLGHIFSSDLIKIKFQNPPRRPARLFGEVIHVQGSGVIESVSDTTQMHSSGKSFWYSLTYALLAAASEVLDIRREELDGLFSPCSDGLAEIVIYDNVPGGAGYSNRIAENFREVLKKAYEIASTCSCETSCYDCLRTYSNQPFHIELDRQVVQDFLRPIVELLEPDDTLQSFGAGSNYVRIDVMANELPALFRSAQSLSLQLSSLQDEPQIQLNLAIPWFKLLTDAVNCARNEGQSVTLVLALLPQPNSSIGLAHRSRLSQWIDEGVLRLFQAKSGDSLPRLVLKNLYGRSTALGLHTRNRDELSERNQDGYIWIRTQDSRAVEQLNLELQQMCTQAITANDLRDSDVQVIEPDRSWKYLSIEALREKLGLAQCFAGSQICKITYSDRYFYKKGAEIFAQLFSGADINNQTEIQIKARVNPKEQRLSPSERKQELKLALKPLSRCGAKIDVSLPAELQHARVLEIHRTDQVVYRITFDRGIDFLEIIDGRYSVKSPTYIVVQRGNAHK